MTKNGGDGIIDLASKMVGCSSRKGGDTVVTYSDLFQLGLLIIGIIGLCLSHKKK